MIHKVDIAICTWNRDSLLAQTLNSVLQLSIPESVSVSVLIVDNNSTDHTQSVIDSFVSTAGDQLSVVGLKEAQQGHTFSRNKAIESATGDLMLWTDDDVILPTNWIEAYVAAANQFANSVFWGSVIEPKFQEGPASWITENWDNLKGCFAHRDLGAESIEFTTERLPYGANFAIRTQTQKEFLYSTNLGRRGDAVLGEDELELFRRVLDACHQGNWVPGAIVQHIIPPDRSTEKYVYDYFVGQGRALVAKGKPWHNDVAKFKSEARSEYAKYKLKRAFANSKTWVSHMLRSALAQGQFEALVIRRDD